MPDSPPNPPGMPPLPGVPPTTPPGATPGATPGTAPATSKPVHHVPDPYQGDGFRIRQGLRPQVLSHLLNLNNSSKYRPLRLLLKGTDQVLRTVLLPVTLPIRMLTRNFTQQEDLRAYAKSGQDLSSKVVNRAIAGGLQYVAQRREFEDKYPNICKDYIYTKRSAFVTAIDGIKTAASPEFQEALEGHRKSYDDFEKKRDADFRNIKSPEHEAERKKRMEDLEAALNEAARDEEKKAEVTMIVANMAAQEQWFQSRILTEKILSLSQVAYHQYLGGHRREPLTLDQVNLDVPLAVGVLVDGDHKFALNPFKSNKLVTMNVEIYWDKDASGQTMVKADLPRGISSADLESVQRGMFDALLMAGVNDIVPYSKLHGEDMRPHDMVTMMAVGIKHVGLDGSGGFLRTDKLREQLTKWKEPGSNYKHRHEARDALNRLEEIDARYRKQYADAVNSSSDKKASPASAVLTSKGDPDFELRGRSSTAGAA